MALPVGIEKSVETDNMAEKEFCSFRDLDGFNFLVCIVLVSIG